jgi:hypothetical protein
VVQGANTIPETAQHDETGRNEKEQKEEVEQLCEFEGFVGELQIFENAQYAEQTQQKRTPCDPIRQRFVPRRIGGVRDSGTHQLQTFPKLHL